VLKSFSEKRNIKVELPVRREFLKAPTAFLMPGSFTLAASGKTDTLLFYNFIKKNGK